MRIGINEIILNDRSSGNRQRELSVLPTLLAELRSRKFDSYVYVSRSLSEAFVQRLIGGIDNFRVIQTNVPSEPGYKRAIGEALYWPSRVVHDQLDVLHTSGFPVPKVRVPVVLTVNDVRFVYLPHSYKLPRLLFLRMVVPFSLRRATRIIAISQNTKNDLISHFGVSKDKVDVAPIPVGPDFHPVSDSNILNKVREKFQLPDHFILYVGHLEPRKNLDRLVEAFGQIYEYFPHYLVILGKPNYGYSNMLKQLRGSRLASRVIFTGYVEDVYLPSVYTLADLLAFPSLHEGFGVPVLEAMACGTPVITSTAGALPEVAGDAAILVNPYNVKAIAESIARVLESPQLARELITLGLQRIQKFKARDSATSIIRCYQKAVAK
jgi:glycosyltransferase involved in cell wall biosynthesis